MCKYTVQEAGTTEQGQPSADTSPGFQISFGNWQLQKIRAARREAEERSPSASLLSYLRAWVTLGGGEGGGPRTLDSQTERPCFGTQGLT